MIFTETAIPGAFVVRPEAHRDERGSFARIFCEEAFRAHGLAGHLSQCNLSHNRARGTLRGLHYQADPHGEDKLVRCISGAIFDVCVDLRADSPTRLRHVAVELTAENQLALYVPRGCAHGFQALADHATVLYMMSAPYVPDAARGVLWNDPALGIRWPLDPGVMSDRDRNLPDVPGAGPRTP